MEEQTQEIDDVQDTIQRKPPSQRYTFYGAKIDATQTIHSLYDDSSKVKTKIIFKPRLDPKK